MQLSGSITALATPFDDAGAIDHDAWQRLLDRQLDAGTRGIVVAGSTGEAAALTDDEFVRLLRAAVARVGGRIPVLAGTGLSNTAKTIAQTRLARDAGADLALVVTPPYVRPTAEGLVAHYRAVAAQGGLPVVLYNVPGRTGCDMAPDTVARLATDAGIVGLKEARGDDERWAALRPLRSSTFALLSGDDPTFARAMRGGADGVVSVASNVVPGTFARLCASLGGGGGGGDAEAEAEALDGRLRPLYDFLGVEPNPIPVKAILQRLGIGAGLRLPLLPLSGAHAAAADAMAAMCRDLESTAAGA